MTFAAHTLELLTAFAQRVTSAMTPGAGTSFRSGSVPDDLWSDPAHPERISLSGEDYHTYADALEALVQEPTLEHLNRRDVDAALWALTCELVLRRRDYADPGARNRRVEQFTRSIERPHQEYEVIVPLTELRLPKGSVTLAR